MTDFCFCSEPLHIEAAAPDAHTVKIERYGVETVLTYLDKGTALKAAYTVVLGDLGAHCVITPNPGWLARCSLGHAKVIQDDELVTPKAGS